MVLWWRSSNLSTLSDIANCCKSSTNKWIQKLTERKRPYVTGNPSYDINFAKYRTFRSTNNLRFLSGILEEYLCPSNGVPDFSDCLRNNSDKWPSHAQWRMSQWPGQFHYYTYRCVKWTRLVFDYLYEHIFYGKCATRMRATSHARSRWRRYRNKKALLVFATMMTKYKEKEEENM